LLYGLTGALAHHLCRAPGSEKEQQTELLRATARIELRDFR